MPRSYIKKLAVIGNTSMSMTDGRKDLEEISVIQDLKTVKCIIWNVKLNQNNKKVTVLLSSGSEINFIS